MNSKIIKKKKCLICNSNKIVLITNHIREGKKKVLHCLKCKIVYLDKLELINYSIKKNIYSTNLTEEKIDYERMLNERTETSRRIFSQIKKYLNKSKKTDLLEIGGGFGSIPNHLKKNKISINYYFSELNKFYIKKVKEKFVNIKHIENFDITKNLNEDKIKKKFDIILMVHVFEHFWNPLKTLKNLNLILKKNGIVIMFMPNRDDYLLSNLNDKSKKNYMKTIFHNSHPFYYDKVNFGNMIKINKFFKIKKINTIEEYSITNFFNWIINKKPQKNFTDATKIFPETKSLDKIFKNNLEKQNKGSTLSIILKKNEQIH